jgi:hypothetical protein
MHKGHREADEHFGGGWIGCQGTSRNLTGFLGQMAALSNVAEIVIGKEGSDRAQRSEM